MTKDCKNYNSSYGFRILVSTASHPIEYAKILIQLGYEPIPPRPATSLFGRPVLKLPNIFQYVAHIKSTSGIAACYNGLLPKLCGNLVGAFAGEKALEYIKEEEGGSDEDKSEDEKEKEKFIATLRKDVVAHTAAIIVSHPFHVITVRMMAQFIGNETKYSGLFCSISEVYRDSGIAGFFNGLIPRLLGDLFSVILGSSLAYAFSRYLLEDKELQVYSNVTASFIASTVTYPFHVVSNCMTVSGSGIAAGRPPHMPYYTSWLDCWSHLSQTNGLKRGSSIFLRYYSGPQVVINSKPVPIDKDQVYVYSQK